jgi:hypothetical protein
MLASMHCAVVCLKGNVDTAAMLILQHCSIVSLFQCCGVYPAELKV